MLVITIYGLLEAEDMKCFSVCSLAVNQVIWSTHYMSGMMLYMHNLI